MMLQKYTIIIIKDKTFCSKKEKNRSKTLQHLNYKFRIRSLSWGVIGVIAVFDR